jgi:putative NADH-flavin reductase
LKLTIIAATGGVGRQLLDQAMAEGDEVTAVVRNPARLPPGDFRVVTADLADPKQADLEDAVRGADAVLSGLGARTGAEADAHVTARGTQAVVDAMRAAGTRRIIAVSAAPIGTVPSPARPRPPKHDPGDGFFMRHLFAGIVRTAFRRNYADVARMEDVLRASGLDWTAVRPPRLTSKPVTGKYRTAFGQNLRGGWSVSRADVAHLMLKLARDPESIGQTVGIAS